MLRLKPARYSIVVRNKPGELAKVTRLLSASGLSVSALKVASAGGKASIQFCAQQEAGMRERLRRTGLRARLD